MHFKKLLPRISSYFPRPKKRRSLLREVIQVGIVTTIASLFGITFVVQDVKVSTGSMKNTILVGDHVLINKFIFRNSPDWMVKLFPQREIHRGDIIVFKFPKDPNINFVKRVVGLPGETIEIRGVNVFINGVELHEIRSTVNIEYDRLHYTEPLQVLTSDNPSLQSSNNTPPVGSIPAYRVYYGVRKPERIEGSQPEFNTFPLGVEEAAYSVGSPYKIPDNHFFCLGDNRDNSEDSRAWGVVPRQNIIGSPVCVFYSNDAPEGASPTDNFLTDLFTHSNWKRIGTRIH